MKRGTTPRRSGIDRQPSQPFAFSSPSGVITGFDEHHERHLGLRALVVARDLDHGEAQALVDLGRREPDALVLVHGLAHVVDELLEQRVLERGLGDGLRGRAQDGVGDASDFQDGHGLLGLLDAGAATRSLAFPHSLITGWDSVWTELSLGVSG